MTTASPLRRATPAGLICLMLSSLLLWALCSGRTLDFSYLEHFLQDMPRRATAPSEYWLNVVLLACASLASGWIAWDRYHEGE